MGNSNSGHSHQCQPPPPWTQSLPRDVHRQKKLSAIPGPKVLPERVPGQRLKPTENGRNLQNQGTISARRITELPCPPSGYPPPLVNHHSSSMTALNFPPHQLPTSYYPPNSGPVHSIRFGPTPSKAFASEPDLRGSSPSSHMSLPITTKPPHTVICESPTKGKIKSKKRFKAPLPPPPLQPSISLPLERSEYVPSPVMSVENWSSISSPPAKSSKSKPRKMGLFKKKSESRMSNYETEYDMTDSKSKKSKEITRVEGRDKQRERSTTPVQIQISSKKELKERARSLDNLQHEIRRSSPGLTNSMHSLEILGREEKERQWQEKQHDKHIGHENRRSFMVDKENHSGAKEKKEKKVITAMDRDNGGHRRLSTVERRLHERQLEGRRTEEILSSPVGDPKRFELLQNRSTSDYHRSSSSSSSYKDIVVEPKDEWDLAEEEWLEKKKKSDMLQKEILSAAKKLKRTCAPPENVQENIVNMNIKKEKEVVSRVQITPQNEKESENEESPKTFFFGMEPEESANQNDLSKTKTALSKLNDQEEVTIIGSTVEYSRHSLRPKEKKRVLERDSWNRSLDYRDKSRSKSREREIDDKIPRIENKKKLSREIDEFVATIERQKLKHKLSDDFSNSISRKGDGGYHSRQNSGSFHLETEGSDEDNAIRMNLRPTLPRRQLELPRFSPNAAWRSLSVETPSRQKEVISDINISDDVFSISEDQIHRYTRPTAPPRTSGEKSADSGISGDAGSPGPMQEFEPLTPEKIKTSSGPLAVSSPVASARLELKRAWTPAQDLDDNSFEENGDQHGKGNFHQEVSTMPKLTSRSNMFSKPINSANENELKHKNTSAESDNSFNDNELSTKNKHKKEDYHSNSKSLQRVKRVSSSPRNTSKNVNDDLEDMNMAEDNWRENWSMSRSIPNSLNTCDEPDHTSNSSKPCRSRSESRMSPHNLIDTHDTRMPHPASNQISSSYFQGSGGHIMYLPEYKSYQMHKKEEMERRRISEQSGNSKFSQNSNESASTPEQERKSPSGDENPAEPEMQSRWNNENYMATSPEFMPKGNRFIIINGRKNKKFSYQSTVRILEKKKLEEKLSKEVEEKEKRRLREMEAMMKVEQEFQKKREREKKRLKKQLQLFQEQQHHQQQRPQQNYASQNIEHNTSSEDSSAFLNHSSTHSDMVHYMPCDSPPPLPCSPPPFGGHRKMSSYQSLPPVEVMNSCVVFDSYESHLHNSQPGLFSGLKKWVKGKKEHRTPRSPRSGYQSDTSSATVTSTSTSRKEPDGAPASSSGRKNLDNIRAEIIAASKHRKGITIADVASDSGRNASPSTSHTSKESHKRTITPDSKRTVSPDSRKSISSDTCQLTQELPEMRQEHRQYREYRRSGRKALMPNAAAQPPKPTYKVTPVSHNYRRDFCLGNTAAPPMKGLFTDDQERFSRHSHETRKVKVSNSKRCSSVDMIVDSDFVPPHHSLRRHHSSSNREVTSPPPVPIPIPIPGPHQGHGGNGPRFGAGNNLPKGFSPPHLTPYNPNKRYRPVSFSPPPPGKILTVT